MTSSRRRPGAAPLETTWGLTMKNENDATTKRRRELIEIMAQVVSEVGIGGATLRKVAERTGSSMGLLTYHYKTKRDLVVDALVYAASDFVSRVQSLNTRPGRNHLEAMFGQLAQADRLSVLPMSFWLSYWDESTRDPDLRQYYSAHHEKNREYFQKYVQAGIDNGDFPPDLDAALAADMVLMFWNGFRVERTLADDHISEERAMQAATLMLDLLSTPRQVPPTR